MQTIQAFFITLCFLVIGSLMLAISLKLAALISNKRYTIHSLFFNFKEKLFMTFSIALFFLSFYYLIIKLTSLYLEKSADGTTRLAFFFNLYTKKTLYIYYGLTIFLTVSITIYLIRRLIIYFYNLKRKN